MHKQPEHLSKGLAAEDLAASFLKQQGLEILERNFSCKLGELDIICCTARQELVFVEVRFRKNASFGGAAASVSASKQRKLQQTASLYLQGLAQVPACRFDVIALTLNAQGQIVIENWIQNAF